MHFITHFSFSFLISDCCPSVRPHPSASVQSQRAFTESNPDRGTYSGYMQLAVQRAFEDCDQISNLKRASAKQQEERRSSRQLLSLMLKSVMTVLLKTSLKLRMN